jgi:hypothetical protein
MIVRLQTFESKKGGRYWDEAGCLVDDRETYYVYQITPYIL